MTAVARSVVRCTTLLRHLRSSALSRGMATTVAKEQEEEEAQVLFSTVRMSGQASGYRLITLNRPKALNALNLNMIGLIKQDLEQVLPDESIRCIVMAGAGDKAFCAGGDIRAVTEAGKVGDPLSQNFFKSEYQLNYKIGTLPKPFIAIIDGITMGGGVGLSVHGPFRVATEHTVFAMPETAIGLFPDVGGSHFLPQLQGNLGMFLALTGHRLKGRDVQLAGVATHFIAREKISQFQEELASLLTNAQQDNCMDIIRKLLDQYHQLSKHVDERVFSLLPYMESIDQSFGLASVEEIMESLQHNSSDWAKQQLQRLGKMSPTSMKVTHRQLRVGKTLPFADCFTMEYRLSQRCMEGKDFYEGVRAVIVDKDNTPKWDPPTLEGVTMEMLDHFFSPLKDGDLFVV